MAQRGRSIKLHTRDVEFDPLFPQLVQLTVIGTYRLVFLKHYWLSALASPAPGWSLATVRGRMIELLVQVLSKKDDTGSYRIGVEAEAHSY
jgi:hypothetical protein